MPFFFGLYAKFYWLVCQNCTLRVHRVVFTGSIFFEKTFFHLYFTFLAETFQVFGKTVPARWPEQHRLLGIVFDFMPFFSRVYAKFCCAVCQNCTLGVHRFVFMGSIFFEKTLFQLYFTI